MGILYTKTHVPASENQRTEGGRTPEAHGTQPASETPSDVSRMTAEVYCVEDSIQQPPQKGNEGHILALSEGTEGRGPRGASREGNNSRILVLSEGTEGHGPQGASREGNIGHILVLSERTKRRGPQGASREGSETPSLAGTSGTSEAFYGVLEESEIIPELIELIETFMAESDAPPTLTDIPCWPCQECLLREGSASALESDLCSSLACELEPRISEEVSEALRPPAVRTSASRGVTEEVKPHKEFKDTHVDVPVAEVIRAQTAGPATQQQPPESVCISGTAPQMVPAGKDAEVDAGMTEEEGEETEIQACSRTPETPEESANRTIDAQEQESIVETPERDLFWFW